MTGWDQDTVNNMRLKNQWKMNMQNKLPDIMRDINTVAVDERENGQVDAREFMRILETRIRSSETQKQAKEGLVDYIL